MKVKSKISYLGERNSILPGQMAEKLAVEVNVKNVPEEEHTAVHSSSRTSSIILFGYYSF